MRTRDRLSSRASCGTAPSDPQGSMSRDTSANGDNGPAVRVEVSPDGRIHTVILHRKSARNAVDRPTADALAVAFEAFDADDAARVAVLCGEGGIFCAGADLKAMADPDRMNRIEVPDPDSRGSSDAPMGCTRMVLSKPVIAAISGFAVAGGLELACWADLRVVEEDAVMGVFCRRWGVPLIDGGTVRLPRLIGASRAMDLILTGRPVDAKEAHAIGLANRVVAPGTARDEAEKLAAQIADFPQLCMRNDRMSAIEQFGLPAGAAMANEFDKGLSSLTEAAAGAARFASGEGRHGSFAEAKVEEGAAREYDAVLFDLGGVLVNSPFVGIAQYEKKLGLERNAINHAIMAAGTEGAFQRLEKGVISVDEFADEFTKECRANGLEGVDGADFFSAMSDNLQARPAMIEAIKTLKASGLKTGILTNNWTGFGSMGFPLHELVDTVVESSVEGMRKPDPRIYDIACKRLQAPPSRVIYLDDIGANLKPARAMGMATVKVAIDDFSGMQALGVVQKLLPGVRLVEMASKALKLAARL